MNIVNIALLAWHFTSFKKVTTYGLKSVKNVVIASMWQENLRPTFYLTLKNNYCSQLLHNIKSKIWWILKRQVAL